MKWLSSGTVANSHRGTLGVMPSTVTAIFLTCLQGEISRGGRFIWGSFVRFSL